MCITFLNIEANPSPNFPYKLVLAFNRQEAIGRPTKPLYSWEDDPNILAGRDLEGKGTWLGINVKTGNIAILTNLPRSLWRYLFPQCCKKQSRGKVVSNFLKSDFYDSLDITSKDILEDQEKLIVDYCKGIMWKCKKKYDPFNLIVGNFKTLKFKYLNTKEDGGFMRDIKHGMHGMTNCVLSEVWEKTKLGLSMLEDIIIDGNKNSIKQDALIESLEKMMHNKTDFGKTIHEEQAIYVQNYTNVRGIRKGTKSTSIILIDKQNNVTFYEHSYDPSDADKDVKTKIESKSEKSIFE